MKSQIGEYGSRRLGASVMSRVGTLLSNHRLIYIRDLLITLVGRDMKLRYKRSILGIAWSLLTPLAQLAVYCRTVDVLLLLNPPITSCPFCSCAGVELFSGVAYQVTSTIPR